MYKLYSLPGSCSTGIHILLNVLDQPVEIINILEAPHFERINPLKMVPVLDDNGQLVREGAAIALYLLEKHNSPMLPVNLAEKADFMQKLFFNYATLHPAYGRLFFARKHLQGTSQQNSLHAVAAEIARLWQTVDQQLETRRYMQGESPTLIDYLLCLYAGWGSDFDLDIPLGHHVERLVQEVRQLPEYRKAFKAEGLSLNV